jgi:hypothetical protein
MELLTNIKTTCDGCGKLKDSCIPTGGPDGLSYICPDCLRKNNEYYAAERARREATK